MPKWVADQKKKDKEKKAGSTSSQSSSVNQRASNSTFMGGGASVKKTEERVSGPSERKLEQIRDRRSSNTTSSRTTAAQRQKMGMPTQQDLEAGKEHRQKLRTSVSTAVKSAMSEDNRGFMQRQKSGTQTESDKRRTEQMSQRRTEVARNTGAAAWKAAQDSATGYAKTLYDVTEMTAGNRNGTQALGMKMGIQDNKQRMRELEEQRKKTVEEARNRRLKLGEAQDKRQAEWDERTKNAKGLEKAWYGAVESGTGMLADTAIGAATGTGQFGALASMGLRTYGTTRGQAEKEGATEAEDRLYSLAQAGKEVGTELMFQGAGLAKKAYGGAGLSLADKAANVLTRGLTGKKADIVGAGVRLFGGTFEENAEEIAGWGLDPIIKEVTYGRKVRERAKESLLAGLPEIGSAADADKVASYFSTNKFTDDLMKEYRSSGLSEDEAKDLANEMRDMYVAYYSNDQETVDRLSEDIAAKISGQSKLGKDSWSLEELGDTLASTTLLTMATGAPGAVTTSVRGNAIFDSDEVKERFGENAVRKIADAVQNVSDEEMSIKAKSMLDRLDSGKDLTGTQKFDLYQGYMNKLQDTAKKARASEGMTRRAMEEQNLVPTQGVDAEGNRVYAQETQRAYNEKYASAELTAEAFKDYMESDNSISDDEARRTDAVKKAVADLHVGGLTVGDAHEFAYGNTLAREVLLSEEGIDLNDYVVRNKDGSVNYAATNEATENALFTINADNAIRSAQAETAVFIDNTRGEIDTDIMSRLGNSGQAVWKSINKDLDPRNLSEYLTTANAASYFYSAGRNTDVDMNTFIAENGQTGAFRNVPTNVLRRAFAAGSRDRIIANTPMYGQTVEAGSNIRMKNTKPIITGQLIVDKDVVLPDSAQSAYLALAMSTNTNVHIVGSLKSSTGAEVNGMSKGNDIYLNVNAAAEQNVGYVLMHEMTHQIKQYAPNEYMALENLVRDRWFNKDAVGMQKAIKDRIDLYSRKGGQSLTEEEAMEEIIADAMAEAIDDPNFAAQVCEEDINLGQAILNSIKDALRSIRALFAESGYQNDSFHRGLLSYLDILDEAEKMWISALHTARQNKADGLIADWQDNVNTQNSTRGTVLASDAGGSRNLYQENATRFSVSEPVERVADLIAVHNLNEEDLVGDLSLGGFPMPSIAITKDSMGHDKYGSISLLFHSSTIDPSVTNANQVFGGDAYTPTFPTVHYKANSKVSKKLVDMYYDNARTIGFDAMRPLYDYAVTIDDTIDRAGGEKGIIDRAKGDVSLKRLFLKLNDKDVEDVINRTETTLSDEQVKSLDAFINSFGKDKIDDYYKGLKESDQFFAYRKEWAENNKDALNKAYAAYLEESFAQNNLSTTEEEMNEILDSLKPKDYLSVVHDSKKYLDNGKTTYKEEKDYAATNKAVEEAAEANGYGAWVEDLFKGIEEKSGIRNNKDMFTPSGNRRSWESLHEPVTLDNVVRQMKKELDSGGGTFLGNNPVGAAQKKYKSLDEIRADKDRLQYLDDENYGKLREVATAKLSKVSHEIYENSPKRMNSYDMFGAIDVGSDIAEVLNKTRNKDKLKKILERDYSYNVSEQNMDDLMDALHDLANLPTGYFEAKPKRAVWFDEVKAAIVPEGFPDHLKAQLSNYGTNIYEYDPEVEGDRTQKINDAASENDLRFSISANLDEPYMDAVNSGNMDEAQRLVDEAALQMPNVAKVTRGRMTKPLKLYHGTRYFGFTQFRDDLHDVPFIYTSTDRTVSAHYAGDQHYASTRPIGKPYREGDSIDDIIENAKTVWQTNYHVMTSDEKKARYNEVIDEAKKIADKIDEFDVPFDSFADGDDYSFANAVDNVKYLFWIARDMDDEYYYNFDEDNGYREDSVQYHQDAVNGFERNIERVREYYYENRSNLSDEQKKLLSYLIGYEVGDAAIDMRSVLKVMTEEDRLMNEYGYGRVPSEMKETLDSIHNIAAYELYGDLGEKPFEFDANGAQFYGVKVPEMGDGYYSTDAICKWAYENGYTSVIMHNIYDYGDKADNYVFFNSGQLKSADPVTYAEDGSVIPLSERFDPTNNDIRYSLPTTDSDGNILTDGQMDYFKNSQARDEQGRLVPLYHTTDKSGFTVFDPSYSDDHRSLFFTDDLNMSKSYFNREDLWRGEEGEILDAYNLPAGPTKGTYAVYLNFENPMIVDSMGHNWDDIPYGGQAVQVKNASLLLVPEWDMTEDGDPLLSGYTLDVSWDYLTDDNEWETKQISNSFDNPNPEEMEWFPKEAIEDYVASEGLSKSFFKEMASNAEEEEMDGSISYQSEEDEETTIYDTAYTTREISEIASNEGHDSVIIRNVKDYGGFGYGNAPHDIYVAFSSNQIKDTRNENPSENPDIRYSVTEDEAMSRMAHDYAYDNSYEALAYYESLIDADASEETTYEKAKKFIAADVDEFYAGLTRYADGMKFDDPVLEEGRTRMAKSKQDYFNSNKTKWNQSWLTEGEVLDISSVKKAVKNLVTANMMDSNTSRKYRADLVNKMAMDMRLAYYYAKQGRTDVADALLWHSAFRMVDGAEFYEDDGNYETYKKLRDYFKDTKISLGEEYWNDTDYAAFRKVNFGRLNLVRGNTNVDKILDDLYHENPDGSVEGIAVEWFNPEAFEKNDHKIDSVPDILLQISDVLDDVEPYAKAYSSEYCAEWATDIASDLLDIMSQGKELQSIADRYTNKYEARIKAMKARHAEAMLKVRQQRDEGIKREKAKFKEYVEEKKEKTAHNKYFDRIIKTHKKLRDRLLSNTADSNIPEQYKKKLAQLLAAFDLQTVGSKKFEARTGRQGKKSIRLAEIKAVLNNIESNVGEFQVNDAITDIIDDLLGKDVGNGFNRSVEGLTIDELSPSELARIDKLLRALLHEFNTYRDVKIGEKKEKVATIGKAQNDSALEHAKIFGAGKDYNPRSVLGIIDRIINMDELTPSYLFRRIDPNKEGLYKMYEQLEDSHDRYIRNTAQLTEWIEDIVGEYHHNGIVKKSAGVLEDWRSENYAKEFKLESGEAISLTPAQMMSVFCLDNRAQAKEHMLKGGIVVAPVSYNAAKLSDLKKKANTSLPKKLTDADIKMIKAELTPEQAKVAQALQKLMAEKMAAWGNEASMKVLGIELFGEPDYFPIKSDKAGLISDLSEDQFVEAIRSFGFTKAVKPGAGNAIMVNDIFDVVVEHCNNMNLYNAYSESINDFMKVFNYKETREEGTYTVKQAVSHAYSQKATSYIMSFMKDLNGNVSNGKNTGINAAFNFFLANAKKASVFANIRVAAQQPTAIGRSYQEIDPKYAAAMVKPEKDILDEMFEHCPIALWKSWGYYDINMGRNIEDVIMNNNNFLEEAATEVYGALDNITWGGIWQMVKAEVEDKNPNITKGSDEYWNLCNKRMREVVAFTQVVDSPFHRSHAMRSKDYMDKLATAFGAEPTLTFNMVRDGYIRAVEAWKTGDKTKAAKLLGRTLAVFGFSAALTAAAAALPDVLRGKDPGADDDDDGYRTLLEKWWANAINNFKDNVNLLNNIYYVKDVMSLLDGWEINNLGLQGFKYLGIMAQQLKGSPYVRSKDPWWKNMLYGMGYLTGVPAKTIMTDFGTMFNKAKDITGFETPILDAYLESMGDISFAGSDGKASYSGSSTKKDSKDSKETKKAKTSGFMIPGVEDGTAFDNFLNGMGMNLTPEEREQRAFAARAAAIADKYEDLSGEERDKKIWSVVTSDAKEDNEGKGFADMISEADYGTINEYKKLYVEAGGNEDYFDERVFDMSKKAMKKTIKYDATTEEIEQQDTIKEYLLTHGMTEDELSDIVYRSDTAKDMKVAFRLNDKELMMETLEPLVNAGLTYEDLQRLWDNRNRMQLSSYKGRYKDKLKSTGNFIWPTEGVITSHFGYRNAPTAGASSNHPAIDIGAPQGTAVVAADGGVVISAGANGGYGNSVGIKHDNGMITWYNHLYSWNVKEGDTVAQGQQIAQVGSTGISTGPHLDFKIMNTDGEPVDPEQYLDAR